MMRAYAAILIAFGGVIAGVLLLFQWYSNRTYRPTAADIRKIIQATIDGTIEPSQFEEFSSARIAYRPELEGVRNRYNQILGNPANLTGTSAGRAVAPLTSEGEQKLIELLRTLDGAI